MPDNEHAYLNTLKKSTYERISANLDKKTIDTIIKIDLVKSHLIDKASANFQEYYFSILDNEKLYFDSTDFFRKFKKRYSLQGIDNHYLDKLEKSKKDILAKIRADNLAQLYFDTFHKAEIKHGDGFRTKELGSFFAKLVHTFRPNEYCALDNPIKDYLGLRKESFFIAFHIISSEYKHWANDNNEQIILMRETLKQADKKEIIRHEKLTDLKLLDLILWSKANRK